MPAFLKVPQLMILTTALQGLKGNLDMCLASRLSTQANLGNMTSRREIIKMIVGNIALVQVQAIVAAICLSIFGMAVGQLNGNDFEWEHALLLAVSCMCTATSSCFILGKIILLSICSLNTKPANARLYALSSHESTLPFEVTMYLSAISINNDCCRRFNHCINRYYQR